jgi:hypothetical protein
VELEKLYNPHLYGAIKSYIPKAIELIQQVASGENGSSELTEENFLIARLSSAEELAALPEYSACVTALLADPKVKSQLWTMVGSNGLRRRSADVSALMSRLIHLGLPRRTYTFNQEYFDAAYQTFEQAFYDEYLVYDVIAPLHNILITGSVRLSDEFEISPLTDDDLDPAGLANTIPISEFHVWGNPSAIRSTFRIRKIVGDDIEINLSGDAADRKRFEETTARVDEVVNAVRLYGAETVYYSAIIFRTPEWLFSDERVFHTRMLAHVPLVYELDEAWLLDFSKFWQLLQTDRIRERNALVQAIRRFGYALERPFNEDRLVDFVITCESLFLSDSPAQGNLSNTLAQRVAYLLSNNTADRTNVFRNIKQAYKLRNAVVHASLRTIRIKDEQGNPFELEQFLGIIQAYTHRALRLMIERAASVDLKEPLFDWNTLI